MALSWASAMSNSPLPMPQATGDGTFMKIDADKKYPTISVSGYTALASAGNKLSLSDGNKVQTADTDKDWKAVLQSRALKSSGKSSWFCFGTTDKSVSASKDNIDGCLSGAVEPSEARSGPAVPTAASSASASASSTPTASESVSACSTSSMAPWNQPLVRA